MAEYYIRRINPGQVQVSKFSDDREDAEGIYTVDIDQSGLTCMCPRWTSRRGTTSCRHTEMVHEFLNAGEPQPFCIVKE